MVFGENQHINTQLLLNRRRLEPNYNYFMFSRGYHVFDNSTNCINPKIVNIKTRICCKIQEYKILQKNKNLRMYIQQLEAKIEDSIAKFLFKKKLA